MSGGKIQWLGRNSRISMHPGKSWNLRKGFSGFGKSWKVIKSLNSTNMSWNFLTEGKSF